VFLILTLLFRILELSQFVLSEHYVEISFW